MFCLSGTLAIAAQEPGCKRGNATSNSMESETGTAVLGGVAGRHCAGEQADQLAKVTSDYEALLLVRRLCQ